MARPHRLCADQYLGHARYFLTLCCHRRRRLLDVREVAAMVVGQLLRTAGDHRMAVHAYCLMPDHLHVLCEGSDDRSGLLEFVHLFKQRSAFRFGRDTGMRLWQPSFFDRHLRADEELVRVARYILDNPVRAGLVERAEDHPHSGSATMSIRDILGSIG